MYKTVSPVQFLSHTTFFSSSCPVWSLKTCILLFILFEVRLYSFWLQIYKHLKTLSVTPLNYGAAIITLPKWRIPRNAVDMAPPLKYWSRQLQQTRRGPIYPGYSCQAVHKLDPLSCSPPSSFKFPYKANTLLSLLPHDVAEKPQFSPSYAC